MSLSFESSEFLLQGHVQMQDGTPLRGGTVQAFSVSPSQLLGQGQTGEDGMYRISYSFNVPDSGNIDLFLRLFDGDGNPAGTFVVGFNSSSSFQIADLIATGPLQFRVSGQVRRRGGVEIAGATVLLFQIGQVPERPLGQSSPTDVQGHFEIAYSSGDFSPPFDSSMLVILRAFDGEGILLGSSSEFHPQGDDVVDVLLDDLFPSSFVVHGHVRRLSNNEPFSDGTVRAFSLISGTQRLVGESAISDGFYRITYTIDAPGATVGPEVKVVVQVFGRSGSPISAPAPPFTPLADVEVDLIVPVEPAIGFVVRGKITNQDGEALPGLIVQAFDKDLRSEEQLGEEIVTNAAGDYEIPYTADQFSRDEVGRADLFVRVLNSFRIMLDQSPILFNAPEVSTINRQISQALISGISEYERLVAQLTPLLQGFGLAELLDADITFLAGETGLDAERIGFLAEAARLAGRTGIPTEAFYGFAREGLPLLLRSLLSHTLAELRQKLEAAISSSIVPASLSSRLDEIMGRLGDLKGDQDALDEISSIPHQVFGRLILDSPGGGPLANFKVQGFDTEADDKDIGYSVSNALGIFTLFYSTPPVNVPSTNPQERFIRLVIFDALNSQIHQITRQFTAEAGKVLDISVPAPPTQLSPSLSQVSSVSSGIVSSLLVSDLDGLDIHTLQDIRDRGGLASVSNLPASATPAAITFLDRQADLNRISPDLNLNTRLIASGFFSVFDVASAPRSQVVGFASPDLGDFGAGQMHFVSRAQEQVLNNVATGIRADVANGFDVDIFGPGETLFPPKCECRDCQAAVSPLAYLADLLGYCLTHVSDGASLITLSSLENTFFEPFGRLPASCDSTDRLFPQTRLCVRVLRLYTTFKSLGSADLAAAEKRYRLEAYTALLSNIGTSFEEIRLARRATDVQRKALADRLGIALGGPRPDNLDALMLDPSAITITAGNPKPLTEDALEEFFGLVDTTRDPLGPGPVVQLESARLAHLRAVWMSEDFPDDTPGREQSIIDPVVVTPPDLIGQLRPVIDPDVIGPDDFRHPVERDADGHDLPFALWLKRRRWVDAQVLALSSLKKTVGAAQVPDIDAMFASMYQAVAYGAASVTAWSSATQPAAFDGLAAKLAGGIDVKATRITIRTELQLTAEGFRRLVEIRTKDRLAGDPRNASVEDAEWAEVISILMQARKSKLFSTWLVEEQSLNIFFGPQQFWISLREPVEGDWPPSLSPPHPLIDPETVKLKELPEQTAGGRAIGLWRDRVNRLTQIKAALRSQRENAGFEAMLRLALGDPLPADLDRLQMELAGADEAIANAARATIGSLLFMTVESFTILMLVRAKDGLSDLSKKPTAAEFAQIYTILTTAQKIREAFPLWIAEESQGSAALEYWTLLKAKLPRWRASVETRTAWQQSLRIRSSAPIVDPDLIGPGDIKELFGSDPPFVLWQARREEVNRFKQALTNQREPNGLDSIIKFAIDADASELELLDVQRKSGDGFAARLDQLSLTGDAFLRLNQLRELVKLAAASSDGGLIASEWDDIYAILTQVHKRRLFAVWREQEKSAVTLGPDHFQLPAVDATEFPPPPQFDPPKWLGTIRARRAWQGILQSRIDQQATVKQALANAVSAAEETALPMLRDALVNAAGVGNSLSERAKWLGDRLLIDCSQSGKQKTTLIAQAIETLQLLLFSLRTGQLKDTYPNLELLADDFDEEWEWMGSYATWRAAMFVFIYPENILIPSLRRHQTPAFRNLVASLRSNSRLTPEQARSLANLYSDYYRDVCTMTLEASCHADTLVQAKGCGGRFSATPRRLFYVFGRGGASQTPYWSSVDTADESGHAQTFWAPLPGLTNLVSIIGASVYEKAPDQRAIYLFAITQEKGAKKLVFIKYDLFKSAWAEEPEPLDLPKEKDKETTEFTAVVKQSNRIFNPPHLVIRLESGSLFERHMNDDGSDWAGDDWQLLVGKQLYRSFVALCAMIEISFSDFYLLVFDNTGRVRYRLFGLSPETLAFGEDGHWESLPAGAFKGAFPKPNFPDPVSFYVYLERGAFSQPTIVKRPGIPIKKTINGLAQFEEWLKAVAGVSLSQYVIRDNSAFNGLTLLQFLSLALQPKPIPKDWAKQRDIYIDDVTTRLVDTEEGREWKLAGQLVSKLISRKASSSSSGSAESLSLREVLTDFLINPFDSARRVIVPRIVPFFSGTSGLDRVAPSAGLDPLLPNRWVYSTNIGRIGIYQTVFKFDSNGDGLTEHDVKRLLPFVTGPFEISQRLSENALQERRFVLDQLFSENSSDSQSNLDYLEEAYYFVPMQLALQLQSRGQYIAALDLFRTVYDYNTSIDMRKIYPGLRTEGFLNSNFTRADDWLRDPLNPHLIAATRRNTYTRFTVLWIIRCLLEFADSEFARDTTESVGRARTLYTTALELLDARELKPGFERCPDVIRSLDIPIDDQQWLPVWNRIRGDLRKINDPVMLRTISDQLRDTMTSPGTATLADRLRTANDQLSGAIDQTAPSTVANVVTDAAARRARVNLGLLAQPDVAFGVARVGANAAGNFTAGASIVTGLQPDFLPTFPMPWLSMPRSFPALNSGNGSVALSRPSNGVFAPFMLANPVSPSFTDLTDDFNSQAPFILFQNSAAPVCTPVPPPSLHFCIPENPVPSVLRLRAQLNLYKLHHGLNIAGIERVLDPYAAATDTVTGLPSIGSGGQLVLPGLLSLAPTPYRYAALIERAKQLVGHAQQIEASLLSSLEKRDAEFYNLIKARQDVRLARAGVRLQDLRIREAEDGVDLAQLQQERAQIQFDNYSELLEDPISAWEDAALVSLRAAVVFETASGIAHLGPTRSDIAAALSAFGTAASTLSTLLSTTASYERRKQEWQFQQSLAAQDIRIGAQQMTLAGDRVRIVGQERLIAQTQLDNAEVITDFLANKFTNVDLYDWMSNILEGVYSFFLQQATSTAQLAAAQLAFERQEAPPPFIQDDYWEAPTGTAALGGNEAGRAPDRRGLTGSARLLQDIFQLDQFAFEKNQRKLHLTKSISLAQLSPAEFQRLRETGVMRFYTPMEMFDRDFPGHYLRLIRRVRTSVVALIPVVSGIRATLSTVGTSRVVTGGAVFQRIAVKREPETVALSSPRDATGLFELDQQPELLLPFEGTGVETGWEFRMPKASNIFDYSTIADVIITVEYTSLNSFDYRQQVIQSLSPTISSDMPFSFRQQFADQWYDLNNPDQTATPMVVRFSTAREDFPPNLEDLRIEQVLLSFIRPAGASFEVVVSGLTFTESGSSAAVGGGSLTLDGIVSTRRGNGASWNPMIGKTAFGVWELALLGQETRDRFRNEEIEDILFIVTYKGRTPEWPV